MTQTFQDKLKEAIKWGYINISINQDGIPYYILTEKGRIKWLMEIAEKNAQN